MRKFTIYHNPRCSKSRQTLALLQEHDITPVIVDYLNSPPSVDELKTIASKLNVHVMDFVRRKEAKFNELELVNKSEDDIFEALHRHPILMERPIVVLNNKAAIGRPPENIMDLILEQEVL